MRKISAVIGAQYGDEGKGLMTDYLSNKKTLVVRFNGGGQAGHTVVTPHTFHTHRPGVSGTATTPPNAGSQRHVFHQFGSGSFHGAATYLSRHFVANPIVFYEEHFELSKKMVRIPEVFVDPRCQVTTPYDIMLNQAAEQRRGDGRHGSCGMGFNETITRGLAGPVLYFHELAHESALYEKLRAIQEYVPARAELLGLTKGDLLFLHNQELMNRFAAECRYMYGRTTTSMRVIDDWKGDIVFEGAQGLLLSQDNYSPRNPHVTRSHTGLRNVSNLMAEAELTDDLLSVYYVTRSYTTRHGAGPMKNELSDLPYPGVVLCPTNLDNEFQGALRYGYIDREELLDSIADDLLYIPSCPRIDVHLAVTHVDQSKGLVITSDNEGRKQTHSAPAFAHDLLKDLADVRTKVRVAGFTVSYGPTRNDVEEISWAI